MIDVILDKAQSLASVMTEETAALNQRGRYADHAEMVAAKRRLVAQMEADGFGGCTNHGECEASCPKGISVDWIARMNADFLRATVAEPNAVEKR